MGICNALHCAWQANVLARNMPYFASLISQYFEIVERCTTCSGTPKLPAPELSYMHLYLEDFIGAIGFGKEQ